MSVVLAEKVFAVINTAVGGVASILGCLIFVLLMTDKSGSQSMAPAIFIQWAFLGMLAFPVFINGILYFASPANFFKFNGLLSILAILVVIGVYIKTEGFYDLFYSNDTYQIKEFLVLLLIVSYFIAQLVVYQLRHK